MCVLPQDFAGPGNVTSLLPAPALDPNFWCYECPNPEYAACVMENDPLVKKHETGTGNCEVYGYTKLTHIGNDPVFVEAILYEDSRAAETKVGATWNSTCSGPGQANKLYNVDDYTAQSVGLPGAPPADETLSDAVCCDAAYYGCVESLLQAGLGAAGAPNQGGSIMISPCTLMPHLPPQVRRAPWTLRPAGRGALPQGASSQPCGPVWLGRPPREATPPL